jgi:hypothetical protein
VLTPEAMSMFLDAVLTEFREALSLLERRAAGDYSPDQHLQTLPAYNSPKAIKHLNGTKATRSCYELFAAYVEATKPAASTVTAWRGPIQALDARNGRSIEGFTPEEAQRWARALVTGERGASPEARHRSASTVNTKYIVLRRRGTRVRRDRKSAGLCQHARTHRR